MGRDLPALAFPLRNLTLWERRPQAADARPLLYVHGATFPTALAFTFRFDGVSWADHLADRGFWPWGLDFAGFGGSQIAWEALAAEAGPLGRAEDAVLQIEAACRHVLERTKAARLDVIAHSWGTLAARLFAARCPDLLGKLVLFGPIVRRQGPAAAAPAGPWRLITVQDQYDRFTGYLPPGQAPVLPHRHFDPWAAAYLKSDPQSRDRRPPAVKVPTGPAADIAETWSGRQLYDPGLIAAPFAVVRGAWDSLCTDEDADNLRRELVSAPEARDIKLPAGTHVMHLEEGRGQLWDAVAAFLGGAA